MAGLSSAVLAQLRDVIRKEVQAEFDRFISPTFIETVTRGQEDMRNIFDAVTRFDDELQRMELRLRIVEGAVSRLQEPAIS